jgi:serine O-acetyltransferase
MPRDLPSRLVYARNYPFCGKIAYYLLKVLGVEIPQSVQVGKNLELVHGGVGVVIHPSTTLGDNVKIYPGVTIGRADIHKPAESSGFRGVVIMDGVILSAGAKILGKNGILKIGKSSIIGANAVLLESTGEREIWAGVPAHCIGER